MNSDQVQLRLNNGAVVDPDDRVVDVVDDREEVSETHRFNYSLSIDLFRSYSLFLTVHQTLRLN